MAGGKALVDDDEGDRDSELGDEKSSSEPAVPSPAEFSDKTDTLHI